jgi:Kip1 ubiquitination-promoting complex protein 1
MAGRPEISLLNIIIVIAVGDTVNSYAYDGNRVHKWNVSTHKYGEAWLSGDIIGCTIDLDSGVIEFYRQVFV